MHLICTAADKIIDKKFFSKMDWLLLHLVQKQKYERSRPVFLAQNISFHYKTSTSQLWHQQISFYAYNAFCLNFNLLRIFSNIFFFLFVSNVFNLFTIKSCNYERSSDRIIQICFTNSFCIRYLVGWVWFQSWRYYFLDFVISQ